MAVDSSGWFIKFHNNVNGCKVFGGGDLMRYSEGAEPKGLVPLHLERMTASTVTAFEPVHACWQALIDEAIERFHHFPSVPHLVPITEGRSLVVWDNLSRCAGTDNRAASYLHAALVAQANRYRRNGLSVSAADCALIAHWISEGALTVIGAHHVS